MYMDVRGWRCHASLLFIVAAFVCAPCFAQAWIAPKGDSSVSLTYQFSDFLGHLDEKGGKVHLGASRYQGLTLEIDHSFSERFAAAVSLPYTATRNGPDASPTSGHVGIDDGRYHMSWQDYHFAGRYNVLTKPVVLTPFMEYVLPSHHYATIGEAGTGSDLQELHVGFYLARLLDPVLPNAYVDSGFAYVFSEKALGIGTNRSLADVSVGYFFTPRLSARALASYQKTYGGLTSDFVFGTTIPPVLFENHDRLLRDDHARIGLAASFALAPRVDVYAGYVQTVWGRNTHYGRGFSLGVSRSLPRR